MQGAGTDTAIDARDGWRAWFDAHRVSPNAPLGGGMLDPHEAEVVGTLRRATAELLALRALQRRVDTKFVLGRHALLPLLNALGAAFDVVLVAEAPVGTYRTLYFDTPGRQFFHDHRQGRRPRHKVRIRHYVERALASLELKTKDNHEVTTKARVPHAFDDFALPTVGLGLSALRLSELRLEPTARVDFPRITLVGRESHERLTLDLGLHVAMGDAAIHLPGIVVGELKQERFHARSPGMLVLRSQGIRPVALSKYCAAMTLLDPELPPHRFRTALRELRRRHDA